MHKILHNVRELLPHTDPSAKPEVFGAQLLDEMAAPYVGTRARIAFCFGASLWADMISEKLFAENFDPATKHEELSQGYMGCYKCIPLYTDAFADPSTQDRFLSRRRLVLARLSDDGVVDVISSLDTLPGVRPYKPAVGTVTQDQEVVERRNAMLKRIAEHPEKPYIAGEINESHI